MYPELRSTAFSFARQGGREALFSRSGFVLPIDHHVFADGRRVALCFVVAPCLESTLCGRNGGVFYRAGCSGGVQAASPLMPRVAASIAAITGIHSLSANPASPRSVRSAISRAKLLSAEAGGRRWHPLCSKIALGHWVSKRDSTYEGGGITNVCRRTVPELRRILYGWN